MATAQNSERAMTLHVPQKIYEKVRESARQTNRSPEEVAEALLKAAVQFRDDVNELTTRWKGKELADRAYEAYQQHLARTGQKEPSAEEEIADLRRIRGEVADELYPE